MNRTVARKLSCIVPLVAMLAIAGSVSADTLLIDRVQEEVSAQLPAHGMSMAQVQARYGAPTARLESRGGQSNAWPTINRWRYPAFTVYFENDKVIDAVVNKASPNETGPKAAIR